ncbi:MAG: CHAT domain-containing protein [candidate division Zixibacteria bacterium]|nr:CHAT domain-containing protein [candidate division Zixibacteria bacterium]
MFSSKNTIQRLIPPYLILTIAMLFQSYAAIISSGVSAEVTDYNDAAELIDRATSCFYSGQFDSVINLAGKVLDNYKAEAPGGAVLKAYSLLGASYLYKGDNVNAEYYLNLNLETGLELYGTEDPRLIGPLNNLAALYRNQGRFMQAKELYNHALLIIEKQPADEQTYIAACLSNLASVHRNLGEFNQAESLYTRALEIVSNDPKAKSLDRVSIINNLGSIAKTLSDYQRAELYYREALEFCEKEMGNKRQLIALIYSNLGEVLYYENKYDDAEKSFLRALSIREELLGEQHPDVALCHDKLAEICISTGRKQEALDHFINSRQSKKSFINYVFTYASEEQKLRYVKNYPYINNALLSFAQIDTSYQVRALAMEMLLDGKGLVLEASLSTRKAAYYTSDKSLLSKLEHLKQLGENIAELILSGSAVMQSDRYKDSLEILTHVKEKEEAELSREVSQFAGFAALRGISVKDVVQALPKRSVLWEIVKYDPVDFTKHLDNNESESERYLLFQLTDQGEISIFDLGDAGRIENLIEAYQRELLSTQHTIINHSEAKAIQQLNEVTDRLHELLFAPMESTLYNVNRVFISPDGAINLIPYQILTTPDKKYIIEKYEIDYLLSGRDMLEFDREKETHGNKAVLIADPDFDADLVTSEKRDKSTMEDKSGILLNKHSHQPLMGTCLKKPLGRVFSTHRECQSVEKLFVESEIFEPVLYRGAESSEIIMRTFTEPPAVLHIATHAYFCTGVASNDEVIIDENPLIYSGLLFAGANRSIMRMRESDGARITSSQDGILTSLEVSGLNLMGTELVVLSACQTGLGKVVSGEGVFGFRRAFQHTGVNSLIMSMWDIPDHETVDLIQKFYRYWISGDTKSKSLRKASLEMLNTGRKSNANMHPLFWSGLILIGNPN